MSTTTGGHCPVCHGIISSEASVKTCAQCLTAHHSHCWDENEGCGKEHCVGMHVEPSLSTVNETTKPCPFCGQSISEQAVRCRHCLAELNEGAAALHKPHLPKRTEEKEQTGTEKSLGKIIVGATIKDGLEITFANLGLLLTVQIILLVTAVLGKTIASALDYDLPTIAFLFELVTYIITLLLVAGYARIVLDLVDDGSATFESLFNETGRILSYLAVSVLVIVLVIIGINLLVVPGIVIGFLFLFVPFIMVDKKQSVLSMLRLSVDLVLANLGQVLGWFFLSLLLNLAGFLALGIGLLVTLPSTFVSCAYLYRKLEART